MKASFANSQDLLETSKYGRAFLIFPDDDDDDDDDSGGGAYADRDDIEFDEDIMLDLAVEVE
jgi:hypothetical protein